MPSQLLQSTQTSMTEMTLLSERIVLLVLLSNGVHQVGSPSNNNLNLPQQDPALNNFLSSLKATLGSTLSIT
jgi:hypothetical protein